MDKNLIEKTADYVRLKLKDEPTGHDWLHVERVWKMAKYLQKKEGGNLELIELAALLHDLGDYKSYEFNEKKGNLVLLGMMDILEVEKDVQEEIIKIVNEAQWNADDTVVPSTLEGKIIQDSDWLDAIGAVGLSRTFTTGGKIGRIIYDPLRKPRAKINKKDYQIKKRESTSINQVYEKILKIPDRLNTKTAKTIAKSRIKFVKYFLEEFFCEWTCKDAK